MADNASLITEAQEFARQAPGKYELVTRLANALERAEVVNTNSGKMIRALTEELLHHRTNIADHLVRRAEGAEREHKDVGSICSEGHCIAAIALYAAAQSVREMK